MCVCVWVCVCLLMIYAKKKSVFCVYCKAGSGRSRAALISFPLSRSRSQNPISGWITDTTVSHGRPGNTTQYNTTTVWGHPHTKIILWIISAVDLGRSDTSQFIFSKARSTETLKNWRWCFCLGSRHEFEVLDSTLLPTFHRTREAALCFPLAGARGLAFKNNEIDSVKTFQ